MDRSKEDSLITEMKGKYQLTFWARDSVHPLDE